MEYINLVEIQDFLNRDTNDFNNPEYYQIFNELHYTKTTIESIFLFLSRNSLETSLKEVNIKASKYDKFIKSKKKRLIELIKSKKKELIELIKSKEKELIDLQKRVQALDMEKGRVFENFHKEGRDIMEKIDCIKKEEQILKEIKITQSTEKMEDNSPAIQ